jgi:hypothetical protein
MECNKWDESGLLYLSGELDETSRTKFSNHFSTCAFCTQELNQYTFEKKSFYTLENFCIEPSCECNNKILSLCTAAPRTTGIGLFSSFWIKRTVFSALVFTLGVAAGGYFSFAYYHAKTDAVFAKAASASVSAQAGSVTRPAINDSFRIALDTSKQNNTPALFKKNDRHSPLERTTPSQGIITVDLNKE